MTNGNEPNIGYHAKTSRAYGRYVTEEPGEYYERLGNILSELEGISSTHIDWFTHRDGRATSCWICEILLLCRVLAGELDAVVVPGLEGRADRENGSGDISINNGQDVLGSSP